MKRFGKVLFALMFLVFHLAQPSVSKTWDEAIFDVDEMAEAFWRLSREKGFDEPLGTTFNEVDVEMHLCAILGRMVGHKEAIAHLEPPQPAPSASGRDFAIAATSLWNWVIAAKYHSGLDANTKRRLWNLDCVGKHSISTALQVEVERDHRVVYDPDRHAIMVQGDITTGFSDTVAQALRAHPDASVVSLGSGGGAVYEALQAGRMIRAAGLQTEVINGCYSACPLVVAGGTIRFMWWPFNEMGLHQVSSFGVAVPKDAGVYRDIVEYLFEMGVDAKAVIAMMWAAEPSEMYIVQEQERCNTRLITNHQRGCLSY